MTSNGLQGSAGDAEAMGNPRVARPGVRLHAADLLGALFSAVPLSGGEHTGT